MLVQLANQVVIDLGGEQADHRGLEPESEPAQPFLRGGGCAVNLEAADAGRAQHALRDAVLRPVPQAVLRRRRGRPAGTLTNNPYGLQGLSVNLGRGIGGNLTAPSVGFLPLLQQSAVIANQRQNVTVARTAAAAVRGVPRGRAAVRPAGRAGRGQLLSSRASCSGSRRSAAAAAAAAGGIRGYLDTLDNFKLQLGLPLTVGLDLDDTPLRPIRQQLARFEEVYAELRGRWRRRPASTTRPSRSNRFRPRWRRLLTESPLVQGTDVRQGNRARWDAWAKLTEDQVAARLADAAEGAAEALWTAGPTGRRRASPSRRRRSAGSHDLDAEIDLAAFERRVPAYEAQPWLKEKGPLAAQSRRPHSGTCSTRSTS